MVQPHSEANLLGDSMNLESVLRYLGYLLCQKGQKEGYARVLDALAASSLITWFASITGHASMFIPIEKYALFIGAMSFIFLASYLRKENL